MIRHILLSFSIVWAAPLTDRKGCPNTPYKLVDRDQESLDLVIFLQNFERPHFSNPILNKIDEPFTICEQVNETKDGVKQRSKLVNYDEAEVFTKKNEIYVFYPLKPLLKKMCPFSRYLSIIFMCPMYTNHQKAPKFIGKDVCDFVFVRYEAHVCFINFTTDFKLEDYKNYSLDDIKLNKLIIMSFLVLSITFVILALALILLHCTTDCTNFFQSKNSHYKIVESTPEKDFEKPTLEKDNDTSIPDVKVDRGPTKDKAIEEKTKTPENKPYTPPNTRQTQSPSRVSFNRIEPVKQEPSSDIKGESPKTGNNSPQVRLDENEHVKYFTPPNTGVDSPRLK
ncbi:hypothetical protein RF11_08559 [Thelohanellus kitauei]|uniref:Uncharacterized protein n=1 Tax=Thelohanellus kitauei TaxID=669202 RepID=A0A0C2IXS5_THEKT|nr:hypothetical protein RF11_08559 [Thelohanellus kitauei]